MTNEQAALIAATQYHQGRPGVTVKMVFQTAGTFLNWLDPAAEVETRG